MTARGLAILSAVFLFAAAAEGKVLVLRNAGAFLGENLALQENCTIEIRDGKIARLNPADVPAEAEVIDATGKFVLPGFVEMHAHLLLHPWDKEGRILPQFDRAATERFLKLLLAHGITTVRDPGAPTEAAIVLRRRVADGRSRSGRASSPPAASSTPRLLIRSHFSRCGTRRMCGRRFVTRKVSGSILSRSTARCRRSCSRWRSTRRMR